MKRRAMHAVAGLVAGLAVSSMALADPCGMVPPIRVDVVNPIVRTGVQKTFVAYSDGTETMVLRPGFSGKVDEFGMLIPFPSSPAIRKVDDNIFPHIAAAIDPPEVQAWVQRNRGFGNRLRSAPMSAKASRDDAMEAESGLAYNEVKVLKQEAVGMYDVAVLAAGSADALKKWMDSHEFRYPEGMGDVVEDYVKIRWVFVAVKTKVGQKAGVNPTPGMRNVNPNLPSGATFNGHVQAMGFRFKTDELVVPMRLSAFNPGEKRNIVYILTDDPQRIDSIPKRYVVRQVTGADLHTNLTSPLPLRVFGGTINQLQPFQQQQLEAQRNPEPHNGLAKELFASDLLAFKKKRLSNPYEEEEKELLAIGESLGMRGPELDKLHADVLKRKRERAQKNVLAGLKNMTLTIVDGDFDREVIAAENLTFSTYRMSKERNTTEAYDARRQGPGLQNQGGKLYRTELHPAKKNKTRYMWGLLFLAAGGFIAWRRPRAKGVIAVALVAGVGVVSLPASAKDSNEVLIERLGKIDTRETARTALVKRGDEAVEDLLDAVYDGSDVITRGWAVSVLAEIGGDEAASGLAAVHTSGHVPAIVRNWAAAGQIAIVDTAEELATVAPLANSFPAVRRPVQLKAEAIVNAIPMNKRAEPLLQMMATYPNLGTSLQQMTLALPAESLIDAMMTSKTQQVRQFAASYLGSKAAQPNSTVTNDLLRVLRFNRKAKTVPWDGGALFLPSTNWNANDAKTLADNLVRWHLWAEEHGADATIQRQIHNNLNQWQVYNTAGYKPQPANATTEQWLQAWGQVQGRNHVYWLLRQQGVERQARYKAVLDTL